MYLQPYLDVPAVCREIHLDHKTGNVLAVADAVQGGALGEVVEIHGVLLRSHGQEAIVGADPAQGHRQGGYQSTGREQWDVELRNGKQRAQGVIGGVGF